MDIYISYLRHQDCINEEISYNDICYKCGKCGRVFEDGIMVKQAKDEKEIEYDE